MEYDASRQRAMGKVKDCEIDASKINAGKESLFSKITKKSKEEQLTSNEKEHEKAKSEEKIYMNICNIISTILGTVEIDKFK
jgi:hypothetical protein